jgi:hypothetical protein
MQRGFKLKAFSTVRSKYRRRSDQEILEAKHFFIYFIKAIQSKCVNQSIFFCRKLESVLRVNDLMLFKEELNIFEGFEFLKLNLELKRQESRLQRKLAVKAIFKFGEKSWSFAWLGYALKLLQRFNLVAKIKEEEVLSKKRKIKKAKGLSKIMKYLESRSKIQEK